MNAPYPWLETYWQQLLALPVPPQALIISGANGRGKRALAEAYAQTLLQQMPEKHPDFYRIEKAEQGKQIGIEVIRALTEFSQQSCQSAQQKVVLLEAADKLTIAAQQAFLKSLEEPVCPMLYILLCSHTNKLLPTVRSRCQQLHIKPVNYLAAKHWLQAQGLDTAEEIYALSNYAPLALLRDDFAQLQNLITEIEAGKTINYDKIEPELALKALYHVYSQKIKISTDKNEQKKLYQHLDKLCQLATRYDRISGLNMAIQLEAITC
jgi:DNA polymerase-3 subunit delta'